MHRRPNGVTDLLEYYRELDEDQAKEIDEEAVKEGVGPDIVK